MAKPPRDAQIERILRSLAPYKAAHPRASTDAYRQNPVSIRVRIIDPDFQGSDRVERDNQIWKLLDVLSEDDKAEITMLLLITPKEARRSFANQEFEHPLPSRL